MIISLTGFMGVGKSTISERLSKHLYCKVVDLDRHIEQHEGMTIDEIFKTKGEQFFREIEELYLDKILLENREKVLVLSLGGGTLI
jgi:shikimate kinase